MRSKVHGCGASNLHPANDRFGSKAVIGERPLSAKSNGMDPSSPNGI